MNSMTDLYRKPRGASPTDCPPRPPRCSTCGMLECLCRPRFFAGQVLTADDLNRLDYYIRGKNRLHNRQLHGWGVVNGLEVTCNPCGDGVAVGCGYALSPCGDDIVVCEPVAVDVCELIKCCRQAERPWDECAPFQHPKPTNCDTGEQEWILAIRYAEAPSRGVKPLLSSAGQSCGCTCGAKNQTACTCGKAPPARKGCSCGAATASECACGCGKAKPRGAPVQCEPTVICEGFAFEVYRKPDDKPPQSDNKPVINPDSELFQRFVCCWQTLSQPFPSDFSLAQIGAHMTEWMNWLSAFKLRLEHYFATHGAYHCELVRRFSQFMLPGANATAVQIYVAVVLLLVVWLDALLECFCSALLPPCPAPTEELRVPLAVLHVTFAPCKVVRVCNWTIHRKFAVNFPALQYWLALLPFGKALREGLQAMCCFDVLSLIPKPDPQPPGVAGIPEAHVAHPMMMAAAAGGTGGPAGEDPNLAQARLLFARADQRLNPTPKDTRAAQGTAEIFLAALSRGGNPLSLEVLAKGVLGGKDDLSNVERTNVPQLLLANQARSFASAMFGPMFGVAGGAAAGGGGDEAINKELKAMRADIDALKRAKKRKGPK